MTADKQDDKVNFMQRVEGSETCLNGHSPIVERPMDGTPWKCAHKGCKYAVDPLPTPPKQHSTVEEIEKLLEDYHDKPHEYSAGCPFAWKDGNWEYCECGLKDATHQLEQLITKARIDELTKFYDWVQSEGRLHSEIKRHYEATLTTLNTTKGKKS